MENKDLISRNPIRFFENVMNGSLQAGEIGAITSKKGLGKTSVLVQIGMDYLVHDKKIVHISFNEKTESAMIWYEDIFNEITKRKNIGKTDELKADLWKNRILLNYKQDIITGEKIVNTVKALSEGGIQITALVIDGLDIVKVDEATVKTLKDFAKSANLIIWFGVNTDADELKKMFDKKVLENLDCVVHLEQKPNFIQMDVLKMRDEKNLDSNLKLDSKTLLIAEK